MLFLKTFHENTVFDAGNRHNLFNAVLNTEQDSIDE